MCIVSCLSAAPACVCGRGAATWGCPRRRSPGRRDSPAPLYRTIGGWLSVIQGRLGPSYFFISLVLGPQQPLMVRTFLKVYMELGSYFLFLKNK